MTDLMEEDDHANMPPKTSFATTGLQRKRSILPIETVDRGEWTGQMDFLMSMIAYAVGLGNVWRFPYLCFKNGGGSFLLVYFLFWAFGAVPIFLMEVTTGQYLQRGGIEMWNICPIFQGVGFGNVAIAFMCVSYYCVIITWALYYLINSFSLTFPWETCDNWWNDFTCVTGGGNLTLSKLSKNNIILLQQNTETSVEQYWEKRVLMQTSNIGDIRGIQWELLGIMMIAWLIIYFALWKGITKARHFVYFCALSPYVLLAVLLIRGLTLPGSGSGIYFYLMPNVTKLTEITIWKDAGTQVFYSYGVGFGALIALGSHNNYNHNSYRDAMILCCINAGTSILAGFVVFSILGYMSLIADKPVNEIVKPGVGLAFLVYPEVATGLPFKQLWAVLFFLMLTILGIDSQVCMMEGLVTALEDKYPNILRKYKKISLAIICMCLFVIGIPMISYAGSHWLTLIDAYGAGGIALLWVVFFEVVGLSWGFVDAIEDMMGIRLGCTWKLMWKYTAPIITSILFLFCVFKYEALTYPDKSSYPAWAQIFGLCLSAVSMLGIPLYAFFYLVTANGQTCKARLKLGLTPTMELPMSKHGSSAKNLQLTDLSDRRNTDFVVTEPLTNSVD